MDRDVRSKLRQIPSWKLEAAYKTLGAGGNTGLEIVEMNRSLAISAIEEILWERGKLPGRAPEQSVGTQILKTLVEHTIDDISYGQMSRIVGRLNRMSRDERKAPKRVADILVEELGPEKALTYVEKAFANGMIKADEYYQLRTFLILPLPRKEIPKPLAGIGSVELLAGQKKLKEDFNKLDMVAREALRKPVEALNKDIDAMRHAWGIPRRQTR